MIRPVKYDNLVTETTAAHPVGDEHCGFICHRLVKARDLSANNISRWLITLVSLNRTILHYFYANLKIHFCFILLYDKINLNGNANNVKKNDMRYFMDTALNNRKMNTSQEDEYLMRILDKGIDDMEAGRELPLDEAFQKIRELRNRKKSARA